jgi:hypothetical protein
MSLFSVTEAPLLLHLIRSLEEVTNRCDRAWEVDPDVV